MRKSNILFFLALAATAVGLGACKKTKSLAELRREERQAISDFITQNGITVISQFPADTVFADNEYFLDNSGLYIHIAEKGTSGTPQTGDEIVTNYYEINMAGDTLQRYWSAADYEHNAPSFIYNVSYTNAGFNTAVGFLQNNGQADIIVPSSLGFPEAQQSITPYRYKIKIKIKG